MKTIQEKMSEANVQQLTTNDGELCYKLTPIDLVRIIELNGRQVQKRFRIYAEEHPDDSIIISDRTAPLICTHGNSCYSCRGPLGWLLRRWEEIIGGHVAGYFGEYRVSYGTTERLGEVEYHPTVATAIEAAELHWRQGQWARIYHYDDTGHYLDITYTFGVRNSVNPDVTMRTE